MSGVLQALLASLAAEAVESGYIFAWGEDGGKINNNDIFRSSPVQVGSDTDWTDISIFSYTGVILKSNNTMWGWGNLCGDNTAVTKSSPVQIGSLTTWEAISRGRNKGFAVKNDGTLWCWGQDQYGDLGINQSSINVSSPVQIGALTEWATVGAGSDHTLAVKANGTLWAWGRNNRGQLGDNTGGYNDANNKSSPVQVGALTTWAYAQGSGGNSPRYSSFARKTNGTIWSWGNNSDGALGLNINAYSNRSSPVQIGALTTWEGLFASPFSYHTFAVKNDNTLWGWGRNFNGQLGDNTYSTNRSSPVQITASADWEYASPARDHSLFVKTTGSLWSVGNNDTGALGLNLNTAQKRSSPIQVGSLTKWFKPKASGGVSTALRLP